MIRTLTSQSWRFFKAKWPFLSGLFIVVVGVFVMVAAAVQRSFNDWSFHLIPELSSQFGGFMGGVAGPLFSLAGFLIIFQTIRDQRVSFVSQQLETQFFQLVGYFDNSVRAWSSKRSSSRTGASLHGKDVFIELKHHMDRLISRIQTELPAESEQTQGCIYDTVLRSQSPRSQND